MMPPRWPAACFILCTTGGSGGLHRARGLGPDPLLRRSVRAAGRPACTQVRWCTGLSGSDRKFPALTSRSGTQRARRLRSRTTAGAPAPWSSSPPTDLRITRVFSCVARGFKARASFMSADCCWWRSLPVDGGSGTSRGHVVVMRRPRFSVGRRCRTTVCFSGWTYPKLRRIVRPYALSPVAAARRCSLLLLSPLLSCAAGERVAGCDPTVRVVREPHPGSGAA